MPRRAPRREGGQLELLHSCRGNEVGELLREIRYGYCCGGLPGTLSECGTQGSCRQSLISTVGRKLRFLSPRHNVVRCDCSPFCRGRPRFRPVCLCRRVHIVCSDCSVIASCLISYCGSRDERACSVVPIAALSLSPRARGLFHVSSCPRHFFG